MWVDGIEIERKHKNTTCYIVDNEILFITDKKKNILYSFNLGFRDEKIENDIKVVAQKTILSYDIIRKLQEDYS